MAGSDDGLDAVRRRIRTLDEQLVDVVAERVQAAREAGRVKRTEHRGIRDYDVERDVVERIRRGFGERGLDDELGARIARLLISEALRVQEEDGLEPAEGSQGKAVVVGGAGKMGRWFTHFLNGLGYEPVVSDPAGPVDGFGYEADPAAAAADAQVVVLSTPPAATGKLLGSLGETDALVFDIASLKAPFQADLLDAAHDHRVTSVHPLWGPSTRVLSGKNVLVLDCGNEEATRAAQALFGRTAANVHWLPLPEHDALMALTLGLPHALNLAYAEVLSTSGHSFDELDHLGGPTFIKQAAVAAEVASENPELYRQIQAMNEETPAIYAAVHRALDRLDGRLHDADAFAEAMRSYDAYFGERARRSIV